MHRFIGRLIAALVATQITLQVTAPTMVGIQLERLLHRYGRRTVNERGSVTFEHAAWATVAILVVGIAAAAIKTLINKNVLSIK